MILRTLGGLEVEGADFRRVKPLLLLAYVALEGAKERRYLAELFWHGAANPLASLSVALHQLKRVLGEALEADPVWVWSDVQTDVAPLLAALDRGDSEAALQLYKGPLLAGVTLSRGSPELEEWVYQTREFLAARVRVAMLALARREAAAGDFNQAAARAEAAYLLPHAPALEPEELTQLYTLLRAGENRHALELRKEAQDFELEVSLSVSEAQAKLSSSMKTSPHEAQALPAPKTSLVGRDVELAEIADLLVQQECQLLTLTGPGGVGKTRLALQAAFEAAVQRVFPGGVYHVALESLLEQEYIALEIAKVLQVDLSASADPLAELTRHVGEQQMLMVLDNFEHLMDAAALCSAFLQRCGNLTLLVTSRERLNLVEEWTFPVGGLALPPPEGAGLSEVPYYDAVNLFVQRAKRAKHGFSLTRGNMQAVLQICHLVEGLPLGLELAAVWTKMLSCTEIAQEIERGTDFLTSALRNVPERHQSMRAVFEHSWRLLNAQEQRLLRRLAVFRGGFKKEAATVVGGASFPQLASLLDKSLLRVSPSGRFDRHPLLYQYMQEKLAEYPNERAESEVLHGHYYLQLVAAQEALLDSGARKEAFRTLDVELENIRAAWRWAVTARECAVLAAAALVLARFFDEQARPKEGEVLFAWTLLQLEGVSEAGYQALARVLLAQGWLHLRLGHYQLGQAAAERALALLDVTADQKGLEWALHVLATATYKQGVYHEAKRYFSELLEHSQKQGALHQVAHALGRLGVVEQAIGDYAVAEERYLAALELTRELNDHGSTVTQLLNLGALKLNSARTGAAKRDFEEGLALAREHGYQQVVPVLLHNLANIACKQGRYQQAYALGEEALALVQRSGEQALETGMLATLGWIAVCAGDLARASHHVTRSLHVAWRIDDIPATLTALVRLAELRLEQGQLERACMLLALTATHPATLTWARKRAEKLLEGVRTSAKIPSEVVEQGRVLPLETLVESVLQH